MSLGSESVLTWLGYTSLFLIYFLDTPAVKELKAIINSALSEQVQQVCIPSKQSQMQNDVQTFVYPGISTCTSKGVLWQISTHHYVKKAPLSNETPPPFSLTLLNSRDTRRTCFYCRFNYNFLRFNYSGIITGG